MYMNSRRFLALHSYEKKKQALSKCYPMQFVFHCSADWHDYCRRSFGCYEGYLVVYKKKFKAFSVANFKGHFIQNKFQTNSYQTQKVSNFGSSGSEATYKFIERYIFGMISTSW